MEIAGLSFVGLGAQAPSPEGFMINDGRLTSRKLLGLPRTPLILTILLPSSEMLSTASANRMS